MGSISYKFRSVKLDQTPFLFHFTKGTAQKAKNTLYQILKGKQLKTEYNDYICFTASPITSLYNFFNTQTLKTGLPMYQPFGIGFSRDYLIKECGARNVIYGNSEELKLIPSELQWRTQVLDIDNYDFEYLREWRIQGKIFDFSNVPFQHIVVVAPFIDDISDLVTNHDVEIMTTYNSLTDEVEPYLEEVFQRAYKGISLEEIQDLFHDDYEMSQSTEIQKKQEDMTNHILRGFESYKSRKNNK